MKNVNFFYRNKIIPIDFEQFNKLSEYFSIIDNKQNYEMIYLLSEFDYSQFLSEESINSFFYYFQNQEIGINNLNVIDLNYLSYKFKVNGLKEKTDRYIDFHYQELIEEFISYHLEEKSHETTNKNLRKYEEIFKEHFFEYLSDDRLFQLPITVLHRLIINIFNETQGENEKDQKIKIIEFLIKFANDKNYLATLLINDLKLKDEELMYIIDKMKDNNDIFDFQFVRSSLFQIFNYIFKFMKKQEE